MSNQMNTNAQAQQIIELVHELMGRLSAASKDGKVDLTEILMMLAFLIPALVKIMGGDVKEGN